MKLNKQLFQNIHLNISENLPHSVTVLNYRIMRILYCTFKNVLDFPCMIRIVSIMHNHPIYKIIIVRLATMDEPEIFSAFLTLEHFDK